MANLQSLLAEQATAQQRLADHREQLNAQRRKANPDRLEQARLRELVDEDERNLQAVGEDIEFERARLDSSAYRAARAAERAKRDRALKTHRTVIAAGWASIESKLRALTAEAAALNETATRAATDLTAVAWAHYPDSDRARTASGRVADVVLGSTHAHAIALLLEDFVRALPRAVVPRLAEQYGLAFRVRSPFAQESTVDQASASAHRLLVERCGEWLAEPELDERSAA